MTITPPHSLPMLDVQDVTPRYTDAQLSGDEPIYEATVYGTGQVVRVVVDIVNGEPWPCVMTDGYGPLTEAGLLHLQRALGKAMAACVTFLAWKEVTNVEPR